MLKFNPFTKKFDYVNDDVVAALDGRVTILENNDYKITYYEIITGTSGSITLPSGATISEGDFGISGNSILSEINLSNKPTYQSPVDSFGNPVTANLATDGIWTSGTYTSVNVALIYSIIIKGLDLSNLNTFYIIESEELDDWTLGYPTYDTRYAQIGTDGENFENVISILNTPPAHVLEERYLIGTSPTGAWVGYANNIAESDGASWTFTAPITDYRVQVDSTLTTYQYNGSSWVIATAVPLLQGGNTLGVKVKIGSKDNQDVELIRNGTNVVIRLTAGGAVLSGNPTANTPSTGDSSTKLATTAFVKNNLATILTRPFYNYQNTDSSVTGSTTETVIANLAIVGGAMGANGKLTIDSFVYKSGTAGIATFKYYVSTVGTNTIGTTGTPASSTLIGSNALSATQLVSAFIRDLVNKNSESANNIYPSGTSSTSDLPAQTTARTVVNINTANNFWLVVTTQLANAGDTAGTDNIQIYIDKP